ncbi:hypothetical protein [Nocardia sp. BMG51109]|uniref:hypothetical protein n=1 Tax=Nocardia sp. BMG51109 TaxID=1056816 RepID=UPI0012EC642A|nr:hypothetical protein [Nocardia sp. BMG51109]
MGTSVVNRTTITTLAHATMPAPSQVSTGGPIVLGACLSMPTLLWLTAMGAVVVGKVNADDSSIGSIIGTTLVALVFAAIGAVPSAIAFVEAASRTRRNREVQRGRGAAEAAWDRGCYCHRCHVCFWPISPVPGVSARYPFSPIEFRWVVWNIGGYARSFNAA